MKRMISLLALVMVLACGCTKPSPTEPPMAIEPFQYSSPVIYFVTDEGVKAVDSEGRVILVDNPDNIPIQSTDSADRLEIQVGSDGVAKAVLDYPYSVQYMAMPVKADREEAAQVYAQWLLECQLANGSSDAIWDYQLKEVAVVNEQGGRIDFLMTYDLTVARNATAYNGYSPFSGKYGQGTHLIEQKRAVTIYGTDGLWTTGDPVYFGDRQRPWTATYADFVPTEDQTVLFATTQAVYYTEKVYLPDNPEGEYETTVWAMERAGGKRQRLSEPLRNHELRFIDLANGQLYLNAYYWVPNSESFLGSIYRIDEAKQQWMNLLDQPAMVLGVTAEAIFVVRDTLEERTIYAIEQQTGAIREVGPMPEEDDYYGVVNIKDGKLTVMYNEGVKRMYEVDLTTGHSRKIP